VEPLALVAVLASTFLVAFAGAKGMLTIILNLMSGKRPFSLPW